VADQNINAVGCLGRVLTILGTLWLGFLVLGAIGVLSNVGISEGFFAGTFGSAIPGVLLLWAGRALRRRARAMEAQTEPVWAPPAPDPTEKRVPSIRVESSQAEPAPPPIPPTPPMVKPAPKPVQPVPNPQESPPADLFDLPPPLVPPEPKTSRQLIDEARKKWGRPRT
jgi:hypothetical protein